MKKVIQILAVGFCLLGLSQAELLIHYEFNDVNTSITASDSSGNGLTGTYQQQGETSVALQTGAGVSGQSADYSYNGTAATAMGDQSTGLDAGRVQYTGSGFNSSYQSMTVAGWFKTDGVAMSNGARLLAATGTENLQIFEAAGNGLRFSLGANYVESGANTYTNAGSWTFFAITYDSTIAGGSANTKFWVGDTNGLSLVASKELTGAGAWDGLGVTPDFSLGNRQGTTVGTSMNRPFDGYIDDFRMYGNVTGSGGALTQSELDTVRLSALSEPQFALHNLFHDNMVVQRDQSVPVWGRATPGAEVTVQFAGQTKTVVASANGKWHVRLDPMAANTNEQVLTAFSSVGNQQVRVVNVLVGDVWLCSGQSNMFRALSVNTTGYAEEAAAANYPLIRHMATELVASEIRWDEPQLRINWTPVSPLTIGDVSATAWYFAKIIHLQTGVPIGLIVSAYGGQPIRRFLSPLGIEATSEISGIQRHVELGGQNSYYDLFNSMIAPLIPYAIRGAIWYQGESNSQEAGARYEHKMRTLMRGWRIEWNQGDFPFYYVQLANYNITNGSDFAGVRQAQLMSRSETNCGMVVTIDIGNDNDVHPANKLDTGFRLAQWALARTYGHTNSYSGPLFYRAQVEGSAIRVLFDYADSGLFVGQKSSTNPVVRVDEPLQNFEIAGADSVFTTAVAVVDADTVLVSNPAVAEPVYVRYCYANAPAGSNKLYNAAGLPASPFRTDPSVRLDALNGSGSGWFSPGTVRSITANDPPPGQVFERWAGATAAVADPCATSTSVTVPEKDLYLLATYRSTNAAVYTVAVNSGSGDGLAQAGALVTIEADAPSAGQLFNIWIGDTQTVYDVHSSLTTLRMPAASRTLTATYRPDDSVAPGVFLDSGFSGGALWLGIDTQNTLRYRLENTSTLTPAQWMPLIYNITGDGTRKQVRTESLTNENGFYRLRVK